MASLAQGHGVLASILGYMLFIEPQVALISLVFFMPQAVVVPILQRRMDPYAGRKVGLVRELGERVANHQLCLEHCDEHEHSAVPAHCAGSKGRVPKTPA